MSTNPYGAPGQDSRPVPSMGAFKDRHSALVAFGILEIFLGLGFVLLAVLSVVGQAMSARVLEQEPNYRLAIPSVLLYVLLAGAMIWIGFGSMGARRWARNLMLIFGWSWLVTGVLSLILVAYTVPRVLSQLPETSQLPDGTAGIVLVLTLVVFGLFLVVLPAILVFFYRSRHVKATCEAHNPEPDWTEACPLSVLTLALWILIGALFMFASPIAVNGAIPFFGRFLSGGPGLALYWILAGLWAYAAWGLYKLQPASWWIVLLTSLFFFASSSVTFLRVDPMEMYAYMGYSEKQLEAMRQFQTMSGTAMSLWLALMFVPYLGYLIYLKKYVRHESD
jgi:hypothetical protein